MDRNEDKINRRGTTPFAQTYYHGTKADLKIGDLIKVGFNSNYGQRKNAKYIFLSATLDAAIWSAELAFLLIFGNIELWFFTSCVVLKIRHNSRPESLILNPWKSPRFALLKQVR